MTAHTRDYLAKSPGISWFLHLVHVNNHSSCAARLPVPDCVAYSYWPETGFDEIRALATANFLEADFWPESLPVSS
jgi:hypothetical protein